MVQVSVGATKTHPARLCPLRICKGKEKPSVCNKVKVEFVGCRKKNIQLGEKGMCSNEMVREYFVEEVGAGS